MSKRILCLILSAVMVFSLLPVFASAAGEDAQQVAAAKSYSDPGWDTSTGLAVRKYLTLQDNGTYDLTMEAYAAGEAVSKTLQTGYPLDIAVVVDQSGSMTYGTEWGSETKDWTFWDAADSDDYTYYVVEGENKYPVYYKTGPLMSEWTGLKIDNFVSQSELQNAQVFTDSDRRNTEGYIYYYKPSDFYVRGADGLPHRVFSNYYAQYKDISGLRYYLTVDLFYFNDVADENAHPFETVYMTRGSNEDQWASYGKNPNWNYDKITWIGDTYRGSGNQDKSNAAYNTANLSVTEGTFYKPSAETDYYTGIYYTDSNGQEHELKHAYFADQQTWNGTLYSYSHGKPRYKALQEAVTDFVQVVADKAELYGTEHRVSLIGFAGNQVPSTSVGDGVYHYTGGEDTDIGNGDNRCWDYVNTGLFVDNQFINYQTITGYSPISSSGQYYWNLHYFVREGNQYKPIEYAKSTSGDYYWWYVETGKRYSYDRDPYHKLTYSSWDGSEKPTNTTYYSAVYTSLDQYKANGQNYYAQSLVPASTGAQQTGYENGDPKGTVNTALTNAIGNIGAYGGTYTSYGLTMAYKVLAEDTTPRKGIIQGEEQMVQPMKVVIVFTDGVPGARGFEEPIAGEALADATRSKLELDAQVYALGLFPNVPAEDSDVAKFMHGISSETYTYTSNVAWNQLNPNKTYYYLDNAENKTYAVTCEGKALSLIRESGSIGNLSYEKLTLDNSGNYWKAVSSTGTEYNVYTSRNGSQISSSTPLQQGSSYYANSNTYYCDYYWLNSDGRVRRHIDSGNRPNGYQNDEHYQQFFEINSTDSGSELDYFYSVADAYNLTERFKAIATDIQVPTTTVTVGAEDSKLKDIITDNFTLPEGFSESNVQLQVQDGSQTEGYPVEFTGSPVDAPSTVEKKVTDRTIEVTGFDYGDKYIAPGHGGQKLIVTVHGLMPAKDGDLLSNEPTSGIYKLDEDKKEAGSLAIFLQPGITVQNEYKVLDFSAKSLLSNAAYNYNEKSEDKHGGSFTYESTAQKLFFTPAFAFGTDGKADISAFSETSSALYFSKAADPAWKKVNVVPANNVYFDDDLTAQQNTLNRGDNGYGYLSDSLTNVNQVTNVKKTDAVNTREITFHGKRLDVYFQSDQTVNNVSVTLKDAQGDAAMGTINGNANASRLDSVIVHKTEDQTMVNVPVISVVFDEVNTYTVVLSAKTANGFRIDGVRVYGAADETDETVSTAYTADGELNADFTRVRELLLSAASFNSITENSPVNGVLFVDKQNGVTDKAEYQKDGPKNEVYLSAGQGVAFNVEGYENKKISVGLRSAESGAPASAEVSNGAGKTTYTSIKSIDIYYSLTPDAHGNVYIKNTSGGILAVTNIKVTDAVSTVGEQSKKVEFFATARTMSYVRSFDELENVTVEPSPEPIDEPTTEPTQQPSIVDWIRQIVSDFVARLFSSIGRLFGH